MQVLIIGGLSFSLNSIFVQIYAKGKNEGYRRQGNLRFVSARQMIDFLKP